MHMAQPARWGSVSCLLVAIEKRECMWRSAIYMEEPRFEIKVLLSISQDVLVAKRKQPVLEQTFLFINNVISVLLYEILQ